MLRLLRTNPRGNPKSVFPKPVYDGVDDLEMGHVRLTNRAKQAFGEYAASVNVEKKGPSEYEIDWRVFVPAQMAPKVADLMLELSGMDGTPSKGQVMFGSSSIVRVRGRKEAFYTAFMFAQVIRHALDLAASGN